MIKNKITEENWEKTQLEEKIHHIHESVDHSMSFYRNLYQQYFYYLDIDYDLDGKTILEIVPAKISALIFCDNYEPSYIVEPLTFEDANYLYKNLPITFIHEIYEKCESPVVDEIWLLNVLQHVLDPDLLIEKAKTHSKVIRFFEPINTPIETHHPHSFSMEDYVKYFGDCVKYYAGNKESFHMAECTYGIYKKD